MRGICDFAVLIGIVLSGRILLKAVHSLRQTTLVTAWAWGVGAIAIWLLTWIADRQARVMSVPLADHAWYACAVLSLCPPIAVLGSRRPGSRVWTWFILCPMIMVLGWPVGSLWLQGSELRGLQLENPQLAAFSLVLIMGVGNFCGTRNTISALLYGAAILGIVVSLSAIAPGGIFDRPTTRFWCSCMMVTAMGLSAISDRPPATSALDQLWFDFFDAFGIVWGRRIQDRVNYQFSKERLPIRLELEGFRWTDISELPPASKMLLNRSESPQDSSPSDQAGRIRDAERAEQILRWLLRRFVNPSWIDQRLNSSTKLPDIQLSIDS